MKRIIICLLLIQVMLWTAVPVFAANQADFTVLTSEKDAAPGDEIVITVKVTVNSTCSSMGFRQQFDSAVFEIVSGECLVQDASLSDFSQKEGAVVLLAEAGKFDRELCQFTLRVKENAPVGETTVSGKCAVRNDAEVLECQLEPATVTIKQPQTEQLPTANTFPSVPADVIEDIVATIKPPEVDVAPDAPTESVTLEQSPTEAETKTTENEVTVPSDAVLTIGADYTIPEKEVPVWLFVAIGVLLVGITGVLVFKKKK